MNKKIITVCLENVMSEVQNILDKIDGMSKDEVETALIEVGNHLEEANENL